MNAYLSARNFSQNYSKNRFPLCANAALRVRIMLLGNRELTFLGNPFESFGRAFDPILAVVAVGRKQADHLIGAAGGRTRDIAGSKVNGLSNGEFMFQRPLHHAKRRLRPRSRCDGRPENRRWYTIRPVWLASDIRHGKCEYFLGIS